MYHLARQRHGPADIMHVSVMDPLNCRYLLACQGHGPSQKYHHARVMGTTKDIIMHVSLQLHGPAQRYHHTQWMHFSFMDPRKGIIMYVSVTDELKNTIIQQRIGWK
jgi:hypothetical protein